MSIDQDRHPGMVKKTMQPVLPRDCKVEFLIHILKNTIKPRGPIHLPGKPKMKRWQSFPEATVELLIPNKMCKTISEVEDRIHLPGMRKKTMQPVLPRDCKVEFLIHILKNTIKPRDAGIPRKHSEATEGDVRPSRSSSRDGRHFDGSSRHSEARASQSEDGERDAENSRKYSGATDSYEDVRPSWSHGSSRDVEDARSAGNSRNHSEATDSHAEDDGLQKSYGSSALRLHEEADLNGDFSRGYSGSAESQQDWLPKRLDTPTSSREAECEAPRKHSEAEDSRRSSYSSSRADEEEADEEPDGPSASADGLQGREHSSANHRCHFAKRESGRDETGRTSVDRGPLMWGATPPDCAADRGREVSAIDAVECFSSLASDLVGASTNCDIDAFLCTINLVDAMKQIFGAAVDIQSAADTCPKESTFVHYLRTVKYPDWPGWNYIRRRLLKHAKNHSSESDVKVPTVSSLYKAVTGSDAEFVAFDGGKTKKQPPHVGILDQSVGGPIIAADETGYVRVGTALAVPTSSTMVDMHGNGNNGPARRRIWIPVKELPPDLMELPVSPSRTTWGNLSVKSPSMSHRRTDGMKSPRSDRRRMAWLRTGLTPLSWPTRLHGPSC
eukprot:g3212.t1